MYSPGVRQSETVPERRQRLGQQLAQCLHCQRSTLLGEFTQAGRSEPMAG